MAQSEARYCACGTRLARDNAGDRCGACARQGRNSVDQPPAMPDEFWRTETMREALQSWHMGQVLYAYRTHPRHERALPQETVANWLDLTQAQLSRIENGPPPQDLAKLMRWAHSLKIPADLLWFKLRLDQQSFERRSRAPEMPSRKVLLDMVSPTGDWLPFSSGAPGNGISSFRGMSLQESGEHLLKLFLHLDDELGGDTLYAPLAQYVTRMKVSVRTNPQDGLTAFGQLNQMVGWLALDANRHGHAKRYLATAVEVGHETGEPNLVASALGYMSLQETYRGRSTPARSLAEMAFAVSDEQVTPLTRTVIGARLARAHAALGDERSLRALDVMQTDFSRSGQQEEPSYVTYMDAVEVAAQRGACYLDLGMTEEAVGALNEALKLLDTHAPHRTRDRVHYMTRLAKCAVLDGELEQACKIGRDALEVSQTIGSARVVERLKEFDASLNPFGSLSYVREFQELFRLSSTHQDSD